MPADQWTSDQWMEYRLQDRLVDPKYRIDDIEQQRICRGIVSDIEAKSR